MEARRIRVRGTVQGVGFRPFVYRNSKALGLDGWVLNANEGVEIQVQGAASALDRFVEKLRTSPPPAAEIADLRASPSSLEACETFLIRTSEAGARPTVRMSPDLPVCRRCLDELLDRSDRRHGYPFINCTECGPRFSIILGLPYDRASTTMKDWPMCSACTAEYEDPSDRRFHAQPVACPECGPHCVLREETGETRGDEAALRAAVHQLRSGRVLAVKGLGGYHLACDANDSAAVESLRARKYRKEKPFALMVKDLEAVRSVVVASEAVEGLLASPARPIVLAEAREVLPGVAPENRDLGLMLPYTPVHHLLFRYGAPEALVMTSANRSSEPIVYRDGEAMKRLSGIADAFLVGERPIARRVEDSIVRASVGGAIVLRRGRGLAPGVVASLPLARPVLAVGGDLKNTVTLVVDGEAMMSQHLGDLEHYDALVAFREAIDDLLSVYRVDWSDLLVVHDAHPQYRSTQHALELPAAEHHAVQHHRAHVASVLAEREEFDRRVLGVALDGTGYGDDGSIWGAEFFVGSVRGGFERVAHHRAARLPGGDAAARFPVQAAAGYLADIEGLPSLAEPPFGFPDRYRKARELVESGVRTFPSTSTGRLFDAAAALLGFRGEVTFEGQAAIWLEHLARRETNGNPYPTEFSDGELDWRPLLTAVIDGRRNGRPASEVARSFHRGLALGVARVIRELCASERLDVVVLSGGVFQNELLKRDLMACLGETSLEVWTNTKVPPNDGGISLGQAALAIRLESS